MMQTPHMCWCRAILRTRPALHGAAAMWNRQVRVLLRALCHQQDGQHCALCRSYLCLGAIFSGEACAADIHSPATTVHEALLFSATLRLPEGVGPAAVRAFVREIERVVEVEEIVHALVGMPGQSGLSVQQRKRLTIAVELAANPSIVFMDEPTTGQQLLLLVHGLHVLAVLALCTQLTDLSLTCAEFPLEHLLCRI